MSVNLIELVPIFIAAVFVLVISVILFGIVKGVRQWQRNNAAPRLTTPATVVAKRVHTSGGSGDSSASTRYHVTFELQDGSRIELPTSGKQYGLLADRDRGSLSYQGTRFQGFQRSGAAPLR